MLVFRKGCTYRAILENWVRESGIIPYKIMEFGALEAILGCVAAGMGVTLFPYSVIKKLNYLENLRAHKISPELGAVPTMFIRRKDTVMTNALDAFLDLVRKSLYCEEATIAGFYTANEQHDGTMKAATALSDLF